MSIDDIRDSLVMVQKILTKPDGPSWEVIREADLRISEINEHFEMALNNAVYKGIRNYEETRNKEV